MTAIKSIAGAVLGFIVVMIVINALSSTRTTITSDQTTAAPVSTSAPAAPVSTSGPGHVYTVTMSDSIVSGSASGKLAYKIRLDKVTEPALPDPQDVVSNGENVSAAPKGQHLAAAQFTVTGLTGNMKDSVMLSYSVLASDHHRYTQALNSEVAGQVIPGFQVQPGQVQTGSVTFVIPDGVHLVSVTYDPYANDLHAGNALVTWSLS